MTLSALGIFSAAGAGGLVAAGDYELISTTLISSNTPSVTFDVSSFASTYKHLQIRATARSGQTASGEYINVRLNGATSYWHHGLEGNGSTVTSYGSSTSSMAMAQVARGDSTASSFGAGVIDILDPFSTTKNKTLRGLGGITTSGATNIALRSGSWASTDAVTSVTCLPFSADNWVAGSRFSIYGLKG
jgi:hypothetical protein